MEDTHISLEKAFQAISSYGITITSYTVNHSVVEQHAWDRRSAAVIAWVQQREERRRRRRQGLLGA